jgi:hypothetical protein
MPETEKMSDHAVREERDIAHSPAAFGIGNEAGGWQVARMKVEREMSS